MYILFLIQLAEKQNQTSERSGAITHGSESQLAAPISTSDCLKLNNEMDSASPARLGDRTDSEQESEQDTLVCQQLGSRETVVATVGMAAKQGPSPGVALRQGSCDGEEKRDQSKEEPSLKIKQQEGVLSRFENAERCVCGCVCKCTYIEPFCVC